MLLSHCFLPKQFSSLWLAHDRSLSSGTWFAIMSGKQVIHQGIDLFVLAARELAIFIE